MEQATQPIIQPVVHQVREVVIQPVIIQPEVQTVVRETVVQAPVMERPVIRETVAAPIFVTGTEIPVQSVLDQVQQQLSATTISETRVDVQPTVVPAVKETVTTETITPIVDKSTTVRCIALPGPSSHVPAPPPAHLPRLHSDSVGLWSLMRLPLDWLVGGTHATSLRARTR